MQFAGALRSQQNQRTKKFLVICQRFHCVPEIFLADLSAGKLQHAPAAVVREADLQYLVVGDVGLDGLEPWPHPVQDASLKICRGWADHSVAAAPSIA